MNRDRDKNRKHAGFTLVEVIVVLVILAILAAVVIPAMTGWIDKAKQKKLIAACRTCVAAAQTLAVEQYGATGAVTPPDSADVLALAGVAGTVPIVELNAITAAVEKLSYSDGGETVTYTSTPVPTYTFGPIAAAWKSGTAYQVGDTMSAGDYVFRCLRKYTSSGTTFADDPRSKKSTGTWEVIGTVSGELSSYDTKVRYAEGTRIKSTSNGETHIYERTGYNLTAGEKPSATSLYWTLIS